MFARSSRYGPLGPSSDGGQVEDNPERGVTISFAPVDRGANRYNLFVAGALIIEYEYTPST